MSMDDDFIGVACIDGADRRVDAAGPLRDCPYRVVALICEKTPTFDPSSISLKRKALQAAALRAALTIEVYVIDVLPSATGEIYPPPVRDLVRWARSGRLDAIVLASLADLSSDRHHALFAAVLLAESGVRIIEAGLPGLRSAAPRAASWTRRSKPKAAFAPSAHTVAG